MKNLNVLKKIKALLLCFSAVLAASCGFKNVEDAEKSDTVELCLNPVSARSIFPDFESEFSDSSYTFNIVCTDSSSKSATYDGKYSSGTINFTVEHFSSYESFTINVLYNGTAQMQSTLTKSEMPEAGADGTIYLSSALSPCEGCSTGKIQISAQYTTEETTYSVKIKIDTEDGSNVTSSTTNSVANPIASINTSGVTAGKYVATITVYYNSTTVVYFETQKIVVWPNMTSTVWYLSDGTTFSGTYALSANDVSNTLYVCGSENNELYNVTGGLSVTVSDDNNGSIMAPLSTMSKAITKTVYGKACKIFVDGKVTESSRIYLPSGKREIYISGLGSNAWIYFSKNTGTGGIEYYNGTGTILSLNNIKLSKPELTSTTTDYRTDLISMVSSGSDKLYLNDCVLESPGNYQIYAAYNSTANTAIYLTIYLSGKIQASSSTGKGICVNYVNDFKNYGVFLSDSITEDSDICLTYNSEYLRTNFDSKTINFIHCTSEDIWNASKNYFTTLRADYFSTLLNADLKDYSLAYDSTGYVSVTLPEKNDFYLAETSTNISLYGFTEDYPARTFHSLAYVLNTRTGTRTNTVNIKGSVDYYSDTAVALTFKNQETLVLNGQSDLDENGAPQDSLNFNVKSTDTTALNFTGTGLTVQKAKLTNKSTTQLSSLITGSGSAMTFDNAVITNEDTTASGSYAIKNTGATTTLKDYFFTNSKIYVDTDGTAESYPLVLSDFTTDTGAVFTLEPKAYTVDGADDTVTVLKAADGKTLTSEEVAYFTLADSSYLIEVSGENIGKIKRNPNTVAATVTAAVDGGTSYTITLSSTAGDDCNSVALSSVTYDSDGKTVTLTPDSDTTCSLYMYDSSGSLIASSSGDSISGLEVQFNKLIPAGQYNFTVLVTVDGVVRTITFSYTFSAWGD